MKKFFINNLIVFAYIILAICFELYGVVFTDCSPILTFPWFSILVLILFSSILILIRNKKIQLTLSTLLLTIQVIITLSFIFLFDSNGTMFEWSMLNQRNDAFGTIEDYSLQSKFLYPTAIAVVLFLCAGIWYINQAKKLKLNWKPSTKTFKTILLSFIIASGLLCISFPIGQEIKSKKEGYVSTLYSNTGNSYQEMGIFSNSIYQILRGSFSWIYKSIPIKTSGVDTFVYSEKLEKSIYNGISSENNLVLILVESFEWYPLTMYPELTETIYPNLYKFMNESVVFDNFYSREKTDTAEAIAILGNYPTGEFVHYDFYENKYPFSLPNLFRSAAASRSKTAKINSFHQNNGNFYNRFIAHQSFGFDKLYAIQDMTEYGVTNYWWSELEERNLDSETIEKMKDVMFPEDELFFSFWITFSMHGFYEERELFADYYDFFDSLGVFPESNNTKANYLRTYAAAVKDFDISVGHMIADLESKNILDDTTIVMLSDHNTYYSNLSYYAKNIDEKFNPELYRIPLMIYDQKLITEMHKNNQDTKISKFTTTSDIVPTVLDLFGISGWKNLYFGSSAFLPNTESIIYSRAYGIFVTDKIICYSLKNIKYISSEFTTDDKNEFILRAKIYLKKLECIDKIYYSNYFAKHIYVEA